MAIGNYREAFPDYPEDLPEIEGFVDSSWHNEPCPCLLNEELHVRLMVDYPDPAQREYDDVSRYGLYQLTEDNQVGDISDHCLIDTDDLSEVLAKIEEIRAAAPRTN
ncbi:hypothetical protein G6L37_34625 [Agrobacterium rubi]|nr:hypothetical protein [Agrobacterium rubi]NTF23703.1 hypothetical protein [Agrobacterium rubi]